MHTLRSDALRWREVDGEVMALDLRTSRYFAVNRTGRLLWQLLEDGAADQELIDLLVDGHDVPAEAAARDVQAFLEALRARDLLAR